MKTGMSRSRVEVLRETLGEILSKSVPVGYESGDSEIVELARQALRQTDAVDTGVDSVILPVGLYTHYKRPGYYQLIGVAEDANTTERMVVYVCLTMLPGPRMRVRPLKEWCELVDWPDGRRRPRFDFAGAETPMSVIERRCRGAAASRNDGSVICALDWMRDYMGDGGRPSDSAFLASLGEHQVARHGLSREKVGEFLAIAASEWAKDLRAGD
jgi:hypothetical protein